MEQQETKKRFNRRKGNKPQAINLIKTFDTFESGYKEVIECCPVFQSYCGDTILYDSVIDSICKTIKENIPSPTNQNYPNTLAFSINSHEVGLKTDSGSAIGWRIVFDKESGKTVYKFRITFINQSTYVKEVIETLKSHGWEIADIQSSRSRFWNNIDRRNNKPRKHYTENENSTVHEELEQNNSTDKTVKEKFDNSVSVKTVLEEPVGEPVDAKEYINSKEETTDEPTAMAEAFMEAAIYANNVEKDNK